MWDSLLPDAAAGNGTDAPPISAGALRKRAARAALSPEQAAARREAERVRVAAARASLPDDVKAERRAAAASRAAAAREARSASGHAAERAATSARIGYLRGAESPDRSAIRRRVDAERHSAAVTDEEPARSAERRRVDAAGNSASRAAEEPAQTADRRRGDAERHSALRGARSPAAAAADAARDAAARREREAGQGPHTLAMPAGMPSDAYFETFEANPIAALALYWARTYNWVFADWRGADFNHLEPDDNNRLILAITDESRPSAEDVERVSARYHARMNPNPAPRACGACGRQDVPMDDSEYQLGTAGALHFTPVRLNEPVLEPLTFTADQTIEFNLPVPVHIADTPENRAMWARFRLVRSVVEVPAVGDEPARRLHMYPELVADDATHICDACLTALRKGAVPKISIAGGWDIGTPSTANLPVLSFAERRTHPARITILLHLKSPRVPIDSACVESAERRGGPVGEKRESLSQPCSYIARMSICASVR